jgi:hypothetical protein
MIYKLTNVGSNSDGFNALATLAATTNDIEYSSLELSFAGVSWFDANMVAPLGVVLAHVLDRYNTVSIVDLAWGQKSILQRNGFLDGFGYPAPTNWGGTVLPYIRYKITEAHRFYDYLDEYLPGKGMPEMTSDFSLRFQQSLGEIFINSQVHSNSRLGVFVCGQFYPAKQRLDISMADAGITIPGRINRRFKINMPPVKALRWALIEGHTTKQDSPGGVGLKLIHDFVTLNGGCFQIASGRAFWEFHHGVEKFLELGHDFPGTVVNLEVYTADKKSYGAKKSSVEM